jgi:hypothetical protein
MGILADPIERFPSHPSEEILEEYALRRLPEALTAPLEEHLLLCPRCQDAVIAFDNFVAALKGAASQPVPRWSVLPSLPVRTSLMPIATLLILALVVVWKHPQEASTPVAVSLSSLRGVSPLAPAPAGKPLRLDLGLPDLVSGKEYRAEVVDAAGSLVWKGTVPDIDGKLVAIVSRPLGRGLYWVRLYSADKELLREFGMSAE